jgi:hypothetical protein
MEWDEPGSQISTLLRAWTNGDQSALEKLTPIVYDELHRLAHHYMQRERSGHSLQTTALSTKPIPAWWITSGCNGRTGRTFLRYRRS